MSGSCSHAGRFVDPQCPIEWGHPLSYGLSNDWTIIPNSGWRGGKTLRDLTRGRRANDGTLAADMTWDQKTHTGGFGSLLYPNTTNGRVDVTISPVPTAGVTLFATVRSDDVSGGDNQNGFFTTNANYAFYATLGGGCVNLYTGSWLDGTVVMTAGQWCSVAFGTGAGTGRYVWYNGRLNNSDVNSATAWSDGVVQIGRRADGGSNYTGAASMMRFYQRLLSNAEVHELHEEAFQGCPNIYRWLTKRAWFFSQQTGGGNAYTLSCTTGTFSLTGNSTGLLVAHKLPVTVGTFTFTGNACGLYRGYKLTTAVGVFTLTGNAAGLTQTHVLTCGTGSFIVTGNSASLNRGHTLACSVGTFTVTGNAAGLIRTHVITAGTGSFIVTGNATNLNKGRSLTVTTGTFTLTGNAANLTRTRNLSITTGSFAVTGNAANLLRSRIMTVGTGVFTLTGNSAGLLRGHTIVASAGVFTLTGNSASLSRTRILTAGTGVFIVTGHPANLSTTALTLSDQGNTFTFTDPGTTFTFIDPGTTFVFADRTMSEAQAADGKRLSKDILWTRTYTFQFSKFKEIVNGDTLVSPPVVTPVDGFTIGTPEIATNQDVLVEIGGGNEGQLDKILCEADTLTGAHLAIRGPILVK